jgi:hypothetical protein
MSRPCRVCQDLAYISNICLARDFRISSFQFSVLGHPAISCHNAYVSHPISLFLLAIPCSWLVRGAPP